MRFGVDVVTSQIRSFMEEYLVTNEPTRHSVGMQGQGGTQNWVPQPYGTFKLNVDGEVFVEVGGAVLRNEVGDVLD